LNTDFDFLIDFNGYHKALGARGAGEAVTIGVVTGAMVGDAVGAGLVVVVVVVVTVSVILVVPVTTATLVAIPPSVATKEISEPTRRFKRLRSALEMRISLVLPLGRRTVTVSPLIWVICPVIALAIGLVMVGLVWAKTVGANTLVMRATAATPVKVFR
jgi:hypothetical protein